MNEREMTQFIYAFLSVDAHSLGERPAFALEIFDALQTAKGHDKRFQYELTDAEENRLNRAMKKAGDRLEQMAGEMLEVFFGGYGMGGGG